MGERHQWQCRLLNLRQRQALNTLVAFSCAKNIWPALKPTWGVGRIHVGVEGLEPSTNGLKGHHSTN